MVGIVVIQVDYNNDITIFIPNSSNLIKIFFTKFI